MDLSLAWLDAFLASNGAKMVIGPAVIAALGGIGYLVKRRIEKQKPAPPDELADLQRVLTFKEKLDQTRTTLDDLRAFRAELLSKPAQAAVLNAEHFLQVAQRLTDTSAKPSKDSITLERATTQLEMNDASARSAVAVD